MKYLKIFEEFFDSWEEISPEEWYDSKMENQPIIKWKMGQITPTNVIMILFKKLKKECRTASNCLANTIVACGTNNKCSKKYTF